MRLSQIILFVILIFLSCVSFNAQIKVLELDEAIKIALKNNRQVKIGQLNVDKAEAAVDEAFGYALPSLDLSANYAHLIEKPKMPFPDFEALLTNATYNILFNENVLPEDESKFLPLETKLQSFAQSNTFETKAQITQVLFNSAVFTGIGASKIYLDLSKVQLQATALKTILNTKKAFYGVLVTKELYKILKESLIQAESNLENIRALYEQGMTSEFDLLQVEVRVENIKPKVIELENSLKNAKNGLKLLLNIDQDQEIDVQGEFNYVPVDITDNRDLIDKALERNLDLRSLIIKRQVDEELIAVEKSEYYPSVAAFGSYSLAGSSDDYDFQTYRSATVGLSLTMNLFKGGRVSNRIEQAQISTMQTQEQITQLEDLINSQVKEKLLELTKVQMQIESMEKNVGLAQKAYDISLVRYKEGTGTQLEIKNADVELQSAKTNLTKALHDHIIAQAELDQLLGTISKEYLSYLTNKIEK
jgi:outer membrane protein